MSTPENSFRNAVNVKISPKVHREKMHNPYRGGTFDQWYSGISGDLWVEYKWLPKIPKKGIVLPKLSSLQNLWGTGRALEGRQVYVVIGTPEGGVVFEVYERNYFSFYPGWATGISIEVFRTLLKSKQELADWITIQALGGLDGDFKPTGKNRNRNASRVPDSNSGSTDLGTGKVSKVAQDPYNGEPGWPALKHFSSASKVVPDNDVYCSCRNRSWYGQTHDDACHWVGKLKWV